MPKSRYVVAEYGAAKANSYSPASVKGNFYSVPEAFAMQPLEWEIAEGTVVLAKCGEAVAKHKELPGKGLYSVDIRHYLKTLRKKPGAIRRSLALKQSDESLIAAYESEYGDDPCGFIDYVAGKGEATEKGERMAEASISQIRAMGESVIVR